MSFYSCCCHVNRKLILHGKDCGGAPIPGATVDVTGPGGFTFSGTLTGILAGITIAIPSNGTFNWTITKDGETCTGTAVFTTVTLISQYCCMGVNKGKVCGTIKNPCNPLSGVTVEAWTTGGTQVATTTTDSSGRFCFCVPAIVPFVGGPTLVIKVPAFGRYAVLTTATFQAAICTTTERGVIQLLPASGYHYQGGTSSGCCATTNGGEPIPDTLNGTDAMYGGLTFTWGVSGWTATKTINFPGCPPLSYYSSAYECPPKTVDVTYLFGGCTLSISCHVIHHVQGPDAWDCPDPAGGLINTQTGIYSGTGSPLNVTTTINHPIYCGGGAVTITE